MLTLALPLDRTAEAGDVDMLVTEPPACHSTPGAQVQIELSASRPPAPRPPPPRQRL